MLVIDLSLLKNRLLRVKGIPFLPIIYLLFIGVADIYRKLVYVSPENKLKEKVSY
jgi:hypothetical protein